MVQNILYYQVCQVKIPTYVRRYVGMYVCDDYNQKNSSISSELRYDTTDNVRSTLVRYYFFMDIFWRHFRLSSLLRVRHSCDTNIMSHPHSNTLTIQYKFSTRIVKQENKCLRCSYQSTVKRIKIINIYATIIWKFFSL